MRNIDWVDRLAGVNSFEVDIELLPGASLTPQGPWLTWPKHRRLLDLIRARVQGHVMFLWFWLRMGKDRCLADAAFGLYDIHLTYLYASDPS